MELATQLKASGWHLTEEGIKTLTSAIEGNLDPRKIIDEALNRDLRDIGGGALATKRDENSGMLAGQIVLQVQRVRNISAPKSNEESKAAPRLIQLDLTDGVTSLQALELEPVPALNLNIAPGTKIYFKAEKLQMMHGFLMLRQSEIQILGGRVEALYEKWDFARTMLKYARSGRPPSGSSAPPPWVAFGKSIDAAGNDRNFKSLAPAGDKDKPSKENDEFNTMRNEAIAVASKAGVKKVFGGGGHNLVDHNIKKILDKGYSKEEAKLALQATRNNLERALFNLKRRRDAAGGLTEPPIRENRRGERPGRDGKRGASLKDEAEAAKPAANATLFDFLTTKLPSNKTEGTVAADSTKTTTASTVEKPLSKHYENDSKVSAANAAEIKFQASRFENNVSSSFAAHRGAPAGRMPRGGARNRPTRGGGGNNQSDRGGYNQSERGGGNNHSERGGKLHSERAGIQHSERAGNNHSERGGNSARGGTHHSERGGGATGSGGNMRAPRTNEQTFGKGASRNNGHENHQTTNKNANEGKYTNSGEPQETSSSSTLPKDQGNNNRRNNERPNNRNVNARPENGNSNSNNRRGSGRAPNPFSRPTTAVNNNSSENEVNTRLNKVVEETANLKLNSTNNKREPRRGGKQGAGAATSRQHFESHANSTQLEKKATEKPLSNPPQRQTTTTQPQQQQQQLSNSNSSYSQLPNGYTYDPSKIMGFQSKETNEFAMSLLKSQGLAIAPQSNHQTIQSNPPTSKQKNNSMPIIQHMASANFVLPSPTPHPHPHSQPTVIPSPPQNFGQDAAWMWKERDLCMAKYWDDGRYYEAEITAVAENTCVVFFMGYGNHEEVLKSDILPITDAQNRPLTNLAQTPQPQPQIQSQHQKSRFRGDRPGQQQQVYVPPHKREY